MGSLASYAVLAPDALHGGERHVAEFGRQLATAPVRRAVAGQVLQGSIEHSRLQLGHRARGRTARVQRHQPRQALLVERRGPTRDERVVAAELGSNIDAALSVGPQQHTARPTRQRRIAVSLAHHGVQFTALFTRQHRSLYAPLSAGNASVFNDSVD